MQIVTAALTIVFTQLARWIDEITALTANVLGIVQVSDPIGEQSPGHVRVAPD